MMDTEAQLAQIYRVLTNDSHLEPEIAAGVVDALMADVTLNPTGAQAIIWDQVNVQDIERALYSDCVYAAWMEACAKQIPDRMWLSLTFNTIGYEQGNMDRKWAALARFCESHNLATLEMVQRWTAQPERVAVYA
jgi:hypothetical protein